MSVIAFSTSIGPVPMDCVISERHSSELDITEIPIETGAKITDHAIIVPKRITLDAAAGGAAATYAALVAFQESRVPFTLVTGLTIYNSMLIKRIDADRDAGTSRILRCRCDLQEVIIVATSYAADPDGDTTGERGKPGGKESTRAAAPSTERAGDTVTGDRATATQQRGDAAITSAPADKSILSGITGIGSQ
ncbi:phage baseplate protein [Rhizobium sp. F40D2]|uniref:phage baseplate protein n=1 Tax=Rhizobium sp. F40D2 TaxID=3453141 RepID=UPI003F285232